MSIVENKKAFHDYFVEERFEAGLVLEGWEVKAIRAGRVQLKEAYVILKGAEPFVIGMHYGTFSPLVGRPEMLEAELAKARGRGAGRETRAGRFGELNHRIALATAR